MDAALAQPTELDADARGRWAALAERAVAPNPYFHPDFVLPAAAAFGDDRVRIAVAGDWEGAIPVRVRARWRGMPLTGTLAWLHDQCFLGTPLLARAEALGGLIAAMTGAGRFAELDLVDLPDAPPGSIRFGGYTRAAVVRRPEPTYLDWLSGKHLRGLRRKGRQLAADLGGELELVDRAGSREAVERFLDLEDAGWKRERGTSLRRVPGGAEFLHAVCAGFAERGALELLFLEAGSRTAAARLNLRAGDEIFCFKIAFDEELRRHSPGVQMELLMLDRFHADPTAMRMDSCADPRSELWNRLWPDRKQLGGLLVPRSRLLAPLLRAGGAAISRRRETDTPTARNPEP
jgi:CelD/BcsL family acetyltransferase involved in cellulose biosynthesis